MSKDVECCAPRTHSLEKEVESYPPTKRSRAIPRPLKHGRREKNNARKQAKNQATAHKHCSASRLLQSLLACRTCICNLLGRNLRPRQDCKMTFTFH
jgi:hypothetical protein